jgi:NAD(P)-dependent dehydrogenase (short-subunit alcohol dehydrogenase family)
MLAHSPTDRVFVLTGQRANAYGLVSNCGSLRSGKLHEIIRANKSEDYAHRKRESPTCRVIRCPFRQRRVAEFVPFGAVTEHLDKLFNINVRGTLFTVQKALPLLKDGGSIILNGSVASVKGTAAFGVYAASKAAIRSLVRTWTTDLKDRRIRSNVVSPGPINTPAVNRQSADVIGRIVSTIPMGRMWEPDEVAKAALFLASDDSNIAWSTAPTKSRINATMYGAKSSVINQPYSPPNFFFGSELFVLFPRSRWIECILVLIMMWLSGYCS